MHLVIFVVVIGSENSKTLDFFPILLLAFSWPTPNTKFCDSLVTYPLYILLKWSSLVKRNIAHLQMRLQILGIRMTIETMTCSWDERQTSSRKRDDRETNGHSLSEDEQFL